MRGVNYILFFKIASGCVWYPKTFLLKEKNMLLKMAAARGLR